MYTVTWDITYSNGEEVAVSESESLLEKIDLFADALSSALMCIRKFNIPEGIMLVHSTIENDDAYVSSDDYWIEVGKNCSAKLCTNFS